MLLNQPLIFFRSLPILAFNRVIMPFNLTPYLISNCHNLNIIYSSGLYYYYLKITMLKSLWKLSWPLLYVYPGFYLLSHFTDKKFFWKRDLFALIAHNLIKATFYFSTSRRTAIFFNILLYMYVVFFCHLSFRPLLAITLTLFYLSVKKDKIEQTKIGKNL